MISKVHTFQVKVTEFKYQEVKSPTQFIRTELKEKESYQVQWYLIS